MRQKNISRIIAMIVDLDVGKNIEKKKNHSSAENGNLAEKPRGEYSSKQNRNQFR